LPKVLSDGSMNTHDERGRM